MNAPLLRSTDIASIAGVSRAAVTQWRKRHADFPEPVNADAPSPLFDRGEIEAWLMKHGRLTAQNQAPSSPKAAADLILSHMREGAVHEGSNEHDLEIVGSILAADFLRRMVADREDLTGLDPALDVEAIRERLSQLDDSAASDDPIRCVEIAATVAEYAPALGDALGPLVNILEPPFALIRGIRRAMAALTKEEYLEVYDQILDAHRKHAFSDPQPVSDLIASLVNAPKNREVGAVLDPAVGVASTLLEVGRKAPDADLIGVDTNMEQLRVAARRSILANRKVTLACGNSLGGDPAAGALVDAVVINPPWGIRSFGDDVDLTDPRWAFGRPSPRAEGIWLQHAIAHLEDHGRAFVVTPLRDLTSRSSEALRHEMLRQGVIEAIITLPGGTFDPYARIETAVWILTRPGQSVDPDRVLLIRVPSAAPGSLPRPTVDQSNLATAPASAAYREWQESRTVSEDSNTIVVSARDLLAPGAILIPDSWIDRRDSAGIDELVSSIESTQRALDSSPEDRATSSRRLIASGSSAPAHIMRLQAFPGVSIIRGRPIREAAVNGEDTAEPVLNGATLRHLLGRVTVDDQVVAHRVAANHPRTAAGDIGVAEITTPNGSVATVVEEAGLVLSTGVFVVRVDETAPGAPDRDYLIACINAGAAATARGGTIPRIDPSRIELPMVPLEQQRDLGRVARSVRQEVEAAERRLKELQSLEDLVNRAIQTGAASVADE